MLLFLLFILFLIIILTSDIKITVLNIDINRKEKVKFKTNIGLVAFSKIKLFSININENTVKKVKIKRKIISFKDIKKYLQMLKINIEKLNLKLEIGTENVIATTSLVAAVSTVISVLLAKCVKEHKKGKIYYIVKPIYQEQNQVKIDGTGIISLKVVNIIHMIFKYIEEGRKKKNE